MKSFYSAGSSAAPGSRVASSWTAHTPAHPVTLSETRSQTTAATSPGSSSDVSAARIAVYDHAGAAPRVEEVRESSATEFIGTLAARVYECARAMGGPVPYAVVREVVENYIHADFREPVVSVLDSGSTIRFSDQGPGFGDATRALEPGYTTATHEMKQHIRGVGSGLPLVRECLAFSGGTVCIEQNLGRGSVVTISIPFASDPTRTLKPGIDPAANGPASDGRSALRASGGASPPDSTRPRNGSSFEPLSPQSRLTNRQKQVLALVMETGEAGPSLVAKELSVGLSTAYRDLEHLESLGLIVSNNSGKRELTDQGTSYLGDLLQGLF